MIIPGLVSITFRQLKPPEIIDLVLRAGLSAIEWGADLHVPHGDIDSARHVRKMTTDAGLTIPTYGSYYRLGQSQTEGLDFEKVLETALELNAPAIRIWAGTIGSKDADQNYRSRIIEESQKIADLAAKENITIAYEYHRRTLTDELDSAKDLLENVDRQNVRTFWQPSPGRDPQICLAEIDALIDRITSVHVFQWTTEQAIRHPLSDGIDIWKQYLTRIAATGRTHPAMIEFVVDNKPQNFLADAKTLKQIIQYL